MIFRPDLVTAILRREKVETRRPSYRGRSIEAIVGNSVGDVIERVERDGMLLWKRHGIYGVQPGRGKRAVARILIDSIRAQRLFEMRPTDAIMEGFASLEEFQAAWASIYGKYDPGQLVYVLRFRLVGTLPGHEEFL